MEFRDCHEEKIHLCGLIQDIGYLFVFDKSRICTAASDNVIQIENIPVEKYMGMTVDQVLSLLTKSDSFIFDSINQHLNSSIFYRFAERIQINNIDYDLSIYKYGDNIYVEIERCNVDQIKPTKLYYYAKYLEDNKSRVWASLTNLIRQIINYDRVMVYQFLEDNSGKVIAESKSDNMHSLMGYRYPEFDIPQQARELYTIFLARHTTDTEGATHKVISNSNEEIDLTKCSLRAMSPIHLQYLRNSKTQASASFSIIQDGKLWGLVTCQNSKPQHVDLAQRHLCTFLTQFATNHHISELLKQDLEAQNVMYILEKELKSDLLIDRDIHYVLETFGERIMKMVDADGIIIKHSKGEKFFGLVPGRDQLKEIENHLKNDNTSLFSTNEFISKTEEDVLFPGIIRAEILSESQWKIYLFRKEQLIEELWAGKPEKQLNYDPDRKINYPSPRTSFDTWRQITRGKASPWLKVQVLFLERVVYIIQQAIAKRNAEIDQLNKDLIRSNNALDTFSYTLTHDLKNPLSSIQLGAQMILMKKNLSEELLHRLGTNILEASNLITEMINKVHELSKSNSVALELEIIDPRNKIITIAESSKDQYGVANLDFVMGEILPIRGERTLLYQLFLNILGNAIKYSSKQDNPKVEVYSIKSGGKVIYFITDNGIGMDLKDGNNIFEIFQRLPNSSGYDGSGIGLSIVKRIIDRLGAEIKVESQLDKGTQFQILFNMP
ncbi:ATP-binding protein [Sphingobacterium spiritivorum]|uniref:histidine kinase n=1 Tax=Sphingobacterium spiritivorum ATCC 33861 TaxID=525373 RepID=D7VQ30_SPHSI|nr:ATP-binding protein [Sphingobacterium spiritivorum]EFK55881.1 putative flagellar protein FliS [Sphingobacterium spiritivorum ATCC 33861]QQT35981.1 GAF domain-containing protein [Sphingobacterium spiritivorum]WQD32711.1 ATP-binding protein [Sphingobacterium spiritivorum]SUJ13883.1 Phytochrome-like protein cph1 [Sphingobacterium spiritivorum]